MEKTERQRTEILQALSRFSSPATSAKVAECLEAAGLQLSERAVRLYLSQMSGEGLVQTHGRRGHLITEQGLAELRGARVFERVGYLSAKIDQMAFQMSFDLATRTGSVVVNATLVDPQLLAACADEICRAFSCGYAMGNRLALLGPKETLGPLIVPPGKVALCTVCSITLNGVLLKHGIPTTSRFGGLLQLRGGQPTRFVELIHYDATTIDPLEVFVRGRMTGYRDAVRDGNGLIGASFRELPADSREVVLHISEHLTAVGLGGLLEVGQPGQAVFGLSVSAGRIGAAVIGGLNPVAVLTEHDHRVECRALAGLIDFHRLIPYEELPRALKGKAR
jgi:HTH-type transcriptional regulator, global nitrogen regulator NrpRI